MNARRGCFEKTYVKNYEKAFLEPIDFRECQE